MTQFDCTDIKAMLSAIVDDQLDAERRHGVERHLATCKPCRRVLDEAESVDAILALDVEGAAPSGQLPVGFADAVLARTTHAGRIRFRDRSFVTLGGWIASAAAIALAMTIWIVDRRALINPPSPVTSGDSILAADPNPLLAYSSTISNSWIYEGPVESVDAVEVESAPPTIERILQSASLTRDDVDALFAAALALDRLHGRTTPTFAEFDMVRRIVEYDELLPRMAIAHKRLSAEDRAAVIAAESIFLRIVRGPLDADDLSEISQTIVELELPDRIARIGKRIDASMSL